MRIDKWLWAARFFKTRAACRRVITSGHLRIDGARMDKPHRRIRPGDVLTFARGRDVAVVRIAALSERRLPADDACQLYDVLTRGVSTRGVLSGDGAGGKSLP